LNAACPPWLMRLLAKMKRVGPRQLQFVRLVLRLYGLERLEIEKPGVGGICIISKRGKVIKKIEYDWPDVDEAIFGKPQTLSDGGIDLQSTRGQVQLES